MLDKIEGLEVNSTKSPLFVMKKLVQQRSNMGVSTREREVLQLRKQICEPYMGKDHVGWPSYFDLQNTSEDVRIKLAKLSMKNQMATFRRAVIARFVRTKVKSV
ncbi:unnamed protein product [Sphenostylis stenocarpa]|uniref:Uncharacterized protein n=1 Tax=Sphenostylis stenocarpa TaxID=92480 RepID=A0AA86S3N9_9FABA|nr:unnamed protein product [Sphenostylis stenocarpa]